MPPGQDLNVDPQLQGFQRLDAMEAAIAEEHGEPIEAPAAQAQVVQVPTETRLEQQGSRPGAGTMELCSWRLHLTWVAGCWHCR